MRVVMALILSFVLAFGSVSMAVAHGQMTMGDTLTICTEGGTETITLDANGNPVAPGLHLCPDCLGSGSAALPDARLHRPAVASRPAEFLASPGLLPRSSLQTPLARGPPALFA